MRIFPCIGGPLDGEGCGYNGPRDDFCYVDDLDEPLDGPPVYKSGIVHRHFYRLRAIDFEGKRHSFWLHHSILDGNAEMISEKLGLRKAA